MSLSWRPRSLFRGLVSLCGALFFTCSFSACRDKNWNPEVAVLVDGRAITTSKVKQVLEWGFYPSLETADAEGAVSLRQILDKLIDENLILHAAHEAGLAVTQKELDEALRRLNTSWFGGAPSADEYHDFSEAVKEQILLWKITLQVMQDRLELSADRWNAFWRDWPKNKDAGRGYQVRILLAPPQKKAPQEMTGRGGTLEDRVQALAAAGVPAIVSEPLWIRREALPEDLAGQLDRLAETEGLRRTKPYREAESWAVYELLNIAPGYDPAADFLAAQAAFETQAEERAFQRWLLELRAKATIEINPAFLERY